MLVDGLGATLRDAGMTTWIDYNELVPGLNWERQLDDAVERADVVVVVVSKRAMESSFVRRELISARQHGKPLILLIAEATPLPPQLVGMPWVDVRSDYLRATSKLVAAIEDVRAVATPSVVLPPPVRRPPESGFRAPRSVWLAFFASIPIAAVSLLAAWTVVVPLVLVPLPVRILRRSFNYTDVRNALIALPISTLVVMKITGSAEGSVAIVSGVATGVAVLAGLSMFLLIRSAPFRRWAKPAAARPRRMRSKGLSYAPKGVAVRYCIDAAREDRSYAEQVERVLSKFGHERLDRDDDRRNATVVLRFVSQFHNIAEIDPTISTIPIVVADPGNTLPPQLQRTQWIDLRAGAERWKLFALAQHLHDPTELFSAIGSPPPHDQRVLPKGVQGLYITSWSVICTLTGGYGVVLPVALRSNIEVIGTARFALELTSAAVVAGSMIWLATRLRLRCPGRLPLLLLPLLSVAGIVTLASTFALNRHQDLTAEARDSVGALLWVLFPLVLALFYAPFRLIAIRRWLPARSGHSSHDGPAAST